MSRRKLMLLAAVVMSALGLGCYLPQICSPVPALVVELKSCLEPPGDDANGDDVKVDPLQGVHIELLFAGFNTTMAGTGLLADADNEGRTVTGRVKENQRLQIALRRLEELGCVSIISKSSILTSSGCPAFVNNGQMAAVVSAVDGVSIEQKQFGVTIEALPSLRKDGRIDLRLDLMVSEPKGFVTGPGGVAVTPGFDVVKAKAMVVLHDGQTCFIGGMKRKRQETRAQRLPVLSDLPGVGPWFESQQVVEFEEERLILATTTLVPLR